MEATKAASVRELSMEAMESSTIVHEFGLQISLQRGLQALQNLYEEVNITVNLEAN